MSRYLPWLLFPVLAGASHGDESGSLAASPLAAIHGELRALRPLRIAFDQTQSLHGVDITLRSTGELVVAADDIVTWRLLEPVKTEHIIGAHGIVTDSGGGLDGAAGKLVSRVVRAILLADQQELARLFDLEDVSAADGPWRLVLTPRQKWIAVALDGVTLHGTRWVDSVDIRYAGGDQVALELRPPQPIADYAESGSGAGEHDGAAVRARSDVP